MQFYEIRDQLVESHHKLQSRYVTRRMMNFDKASSFKPDLQEHFCMRSIYLAIPNILRRIVGCSIISLSSQPVFLLIC